MTRRKILQETATTSTVALSSFLFLNNINNNSNNKLTSPFLKSALAATTTNKDYITDKQTVVITGCNSGIGYDAAQRLASRGHRIIMACRTLAKAEQAASTIQQSLRRLQEENDNSNTNNLEQAGDIGTSRRNKYEIIIGKDLIPMECDLASLTSIERFVNDLKSAELEGEDKNIFDVVCYNAGLSRNTDAKDVARTKEGFELTVGTNHLGHFYLNHLLSPMIKPNTGRIVVTASSVHDPDSPGGSQGAKATLGNLAGLEAGPQFDMVDGGEFNADKAYKDSKLCNVFFTRELQRRLDVAGTGIHANCFTPGLIVGTGLFRDQNPIFTKVFDVAATNLLKVGETPHYGGGALEYMALDKSVGSKGGLYYFSPPGSSKYGEDAYGEQFTVADVSKEAQDDAKGRRLWELSEKLVGIKS